MFMSRSYAEATNAAVADLAVLWAEAGMVMALRMWMLGFGLAPPSEEHRMFDEKPAAFSSAALAAWAAAGRSAWGLPFDPLRAAFAGAEAWTGSLTRKTRSNRRRLIRGALPG
jgi:hypothetical protein